MKSTGRWRSGPALAATLRLLLDSPHVAPFLLSDGRDISRKARRLFIQSSLVSQERREEVIQCVRLRTKFRGSILKVQPNERVIYYPSSDSGFATE